MTENPCKSCPLSPDEKSACCGCQERLEWEKKQEVSER